MWRERTAARVAGLGFARTAPTLSDGDIDEVHPQRIIAKCPVHHVVSRTEACTRIQAVFKAVVGGWFFPNNAPDRVPARNAQ